MPSAGGGGVVSRLGALLLPNGFPGDLIIRIKCLPVSEKTGECGVEIKRWKYFSSASSTTEGTCMWNEVIFAFLFNPNGITAVCFDRCSTCLV